MGKMNWDKKSNRNATPKHINQNRILTKLRTREEWATYREGNFWIRDRLVERYHPKRKERIVTGLAFNADAGKFEVWKDGKKLSEMGWKVGQPALIEWSKKLGC